MQKLVRLLLVSLLAACGPQGGPVAGKRHAPGPLPSVPSLNAATPYGSTVWDNGTLAQLFVHLTHDLEWGGARPNLVRLEAPISIGITGCCASDYATFLDGFLAELRSQTGIAIRRAAAPHNLLIHFVPGNDFRSRVPAHLCVVAPGRLPWNRFRESPERFGTRAFEQRREAGAMSVYIPDTLPPYLVRRCMIEEVTQALGLANDLSGLGDTIFNDDGVHIWPTALDYLMMRVLYSPTIRTGLNRNETRNRARSELDRINPSGRSAPPLPKLNIRAMRDWSEQIAAAFDRTKSESERTRSAETALNLASGRLRNSPQHCRSLIVAARLTQAAPDRALRRLNASAQVCRAAHGPRDPRIGLVNLARARALFRLGRTSEAYGLSDGLEASLAAHGQSERLVALYALQAAALKAIQQPESSARAARSAAAWAEYSLGRNHPEARRLANR